MTIREVCRVILVAVGATLCGGHWAPDVSPSPAPNNP